MKQLETRLMSISTEDPWGIGLNECSQRYLRKSMDRLFFQADHDTGPDQEFLLSNLEMSWNFAQHSKIIIPHCHHFRIMLCLIGSLEESSSLCDRITLMQLARERTDQLREIYFIYRATDTTQQNVVDFRSFAVHEKVWFQRSKHR